ncbi:MAG: Ig-like domain-containing protein, partial [Planctomycetota bacterium]
FQNLDQDPEESTKTVSMSFDNQTADPAQAVIQIDPVNDPPDIVSHTGTVRVYEGGTGTGSVEFSDLDQDPEVPFLIDMLQHPSKGDLVFAASEEGFVWSYTANDDVAGSDTFSYRLRDADGGRSSPIDVTVELIDINDPPVFSRIPGTERFELLEDEALHNVPVVRDILPCAGNPAHEQQQSMHFELEHNSAPKLFDEPPKLSAGGALSLVPAADAVGTATLVFRLYDDGGTDLGGDDSGESLSLVVTVIDDLADPPQLVMDTYHAVAGQRADFRLQARSDGEAGIASFMKVTDPGHGSLDLDPVTGACSYILAHFPRSQSCTVTIDDHFRVLLVDDNGNSAEQEVQIVVTDPDPQCDDDDVPPPVVRILSPPPMESATVGARIDFEANADLSAVSEQTMLYWSVDGVSSELVTIDSAGARAQITVTAPSLPGVYRLIVRCSDRLGGSSDVQVFYLSVHDDPVQSDG